jgi:poly-gamma-glutamate synthesis protein (capsule biosynthesis protein)
MDQITLLCLGDVMTGRGIDQILPHPSDPRLYEPYMRSALDYVRIAERTNGPIPPLADFTYVWGDALAELRERAPDVCVANLETSITASDTPAAKGINYRMHPRNVPCLTTGGIDCCVLANNHVLDWEEAGLLDTLSALRDGGVRTAGAGRTLGEAQEPALLDLGATGRVLIAACGCESSGIPPNWVAGAARPGVSLLPDLSDAAAAAVAERLRLCKRPDDVSVVSIHWGGNWDYRIHPEHQRFAHALIDSGHVDLVHGHSSHHAKGIEVYRGRPILYGCGDFLNDYEGIGQHGEFRADLPLMYFVSVKPETGELARLEIVPFRIKRFRLQYASPDEMQWVGNLLNREGAALGTRVQPTRRGVLEVAWAQQHAASPSKEDRRL